jgi:hypothetical protein
MPEESSGACDSRAQRDQAAAGSRSPDFVRRRLRVAGLAVDGVLVLAVGFSFGTVCARGMRTGASSAGLSVQCVTPCRDVTG